MFTKRFPYKKPRVETKVLIKINQKLDELAQRFWHSWVVFRLLVFINIILLFRIIMYVRILSSSLHNSTEVPLEAAGTRCEISILN